MRNKHAKLIFFFFLKKQHSFCTHFYPCDCQSNLQTAQIYITPCSKNIWALPLHSWTGYFRKHISIIAVFLWNHQNCFSCSDGVPCSLSEHEPIVCRSSQLKQRSDSDLRHVTVAFNVCPDRGWRATRWHLAAFPVLHWIPGMNSHKWLSDQVSQCSLYHKHNGQTQHTPLKIF